MATDTVALNLLYTDLGYKAATMPDDVKALINEKLQAADDRLLAAGIDVTAGTAGIRDLRVMYAAYLYRHRNSDKPMPLSLRLAINDAKVSAATAEEDTA